VSPVAQLRQREGRCDIRHESAIHDVDVNPVGAGLFHGVNFFVEPPKSADKMEGAILIFVIACSLSFASPTSNDKESPLLAIWQ